MPEGRRTMQVMSLEEQVAAEPEVPEKDDGDLTDLLGELRVLLPGAQTLTAFLIILPFSNGFNRIAGEEKTVYVITFLCSLLSLVLFTAPAAHHRLQRPLHDRRGFKTTATKFIIAGLVPLSVALILATQLVISEVVASRIVSWIISGILAVIILVLWWIVPARRHRRLSEAQQRHS
jgi:hypothetical protein